MTLNTGKNGFANIIAKYVERFPCDVINTGYTINRVQLYPFVTNRLKIEYLWEYETSCNIVLDFENQDSMNERKNM